VIYGRRQQTLHDYEGFIEKQKPKKTTDDCYTPEDVYEAVRDWAVAEYGLEGREVVRPFWPGGDYEMYDYPDGCVVIDNQPFSMTAEIVRFYMGNRLDFFIFAPHLTCFNAQANIVLAGAGVKYANGAVVPTSFLTSLGRYRVMTAPGLYEAIGSCPSQKSDKRQLPRYTWPDEVLRTTSLDAVIANGGRFTLLDSECAPIVGGRLDCGRNVFGGGFLVSRAAAARAAEPVTLSTSELALVDTLGEGNG
jgi:hypothetical protein